MRIGFKKLLLSFQILLILCAHSTYAESICDQLLAATESRLNAGGTSLHFDEAQLEQVFAKPESSVELSLRIYAIAAIGKILSTNSNTLVTDPRDPAKLIPVSEWLQHFTRHHDQASALERREAYLYQGMLAINRLLQSPEGEALITERAADLSSLRAYVEARARGALPH